VGFSASEVGCRLEEVLAGKGSNDTIAATLKAKTRYEVSGEKIRKARKGEGQSIAHDLLVAVAITYGVDLAWLLTGTAGANGREQRDPAGQAFDQTALAELYRRIDAIEAEDAPSWLKALRTDALAAAVRAEAMRQAEAASLERASAIRSAEEAARERAAAAGKEVEGATARALALMDTSPPESVHVQAGIRYAQEAMAKAARSGRGAATGTEPPSPK
jgi:hypothetical protein